MKQLFITRLEIKKVRHLNDISIPLSGNKIRHLILTGKNGSGKTSVVEALADCLYNMLKDLEGIPKGNNLDIKFNAEQKRFLQERNITL